MNSIVSIVLSVFLLLSQANALHFYLKTGETRCFFEELPQDALVVGKIDVYELNQNTNDYHKSPYLGLQITVDVCIHLFFHRLRQLTNILF